MHRPVTRDILGVINSGRTSPDRIRGRRFDQRFTQSPSATEVATPWENSEHGK
jgi:hypothetical protein